MSVLKSFLEYIFGTKKQKEEKQEIYTPHYSYDINSKHESEIKIGQIWQFTPTRNPFNQDEIGHLVEIKGYKDGYVNYKFYKSNMFQNQVLEESFFRKIYKLKEN